MSSSDHCRHSHKSTINACSWNPDGHLVATAGGDGTVRLFDIRTFRELEALKGHTKEVNCAWSLLLEYELLGTAC
jgi:polyadenylation factor subunit 2